MLSANFVKHLTKLRQKKYRKENNEFLIEGFKGVTAALLSDVKIISIVIDDKNKKIDKVEKIKKEAERKNIKIFSCDKKEADKIKTTENFSGVLAVVKYFPYTFNDLMNKKSLIILDRINDPGNLGTIIRTADWFGLDNILLSEDCVDLYNEKTVRSTMGSIFHVKIAESKNIVQSIELLKKNGYNINLLLVTGDDVKNLPTGNNNVYVFGSESHGIRPEVKALGDKKYTIAGKGKAESLNVSVAVGIILSKI